MTRTTSPVLLNTENTENPESHLLNPTAKSVSLDQVSSPPQSKKQPNNDGWVTVGSAKKIIGSANEQPTIVATVL